MLGLDEAAAFLEGRGLGHQPAGELYERIVTPYIAVNSLTPRLGRL